MDQNSFCETFSSKQLSPEEIDNLYKQSLKRMDVAIFGARLDFISDGDQKKEKIYRDLCMQRETIEKDYQAWQGSIRDE